MLTIDHTKSRAFFCFFTFFSIFFFLHCNISYSAGPVTHLFFAEKWIEQFGSLEEPARYEFLSGNLFPDIRYLGIVTRIETHEANLTLEDVHSSSTPFLTGTRLHSYVDEKRDALVETSGIYAWIAPYAQGHEVVLLKLLEDEILYDRIETLLAKLQVYRISEPERFTGIPDKVLEKWHFFLYYYLSRRPTQVLREFAEEDQVFLGIPANLLAGWSDAMQQLAQQPEVLDYMQTLENLL